MKARRVLQLIVGWLAAIFTPIFAGLGILSFVPFLPSYIFSTTVSTPLYASILEGIREVCQIIPIGFVNPRPYLFACIAFILPTFLLWIASHILFSENRGKQGKYNAANILVLIAIVLNCGLCGGFVKTILGDKAMIGVYVISSIAFVFILFALLALLIKGKAQCLCTLCECAECSANEDCQACLDCYVCDDCRVCDTCKTRECESEECCCEECACDECDDETVATEEAEAAVEEAVEAPVEEVVEVVEAPVEAAVEEPAEAPAEEVAEAAAPAEEVVEAVEAPVEAPVAAQEPASVAQVVNSTYTTPSQTLTSANMKKLEVLRNLYVGGAITKEEYTALVKEYLK